MSTTASVVKPNFTKRNPVIDPPKPKLPTLKQKSCAACGTSDCHNGTRVQLDGQSYMVRVCKNPKCRQTLQDKDFLSKAKTVGQLVESQDKDKKARRLIR